MNNIYYKLYKSKRNNNKISVVTMQWFDEYDYDENLFLKDKDGEHLSFDNYDDAVQWVNNNIKPELIDEDILILNDDVY
jgi:hypothetical protein